ncbi:AAA family ATPase [Halomicronema sp. CCY15110]|uniref:AAA family ATPase n=1 Tax=Halomicronema sp. CCY15110 TaxID=2767773 RepID=UPI001950D70A|nr:AAA family ATPase [Halomicronema sp. CCY15110]
MPASIDIPLWLLIGLPDSGKSTWARHFRQADPAIAYISTDQIRGELFGDEATQGPWPQVWECVGQKMRGAAQQTQQGQLSGALYDATNVQRRGRRRVIQTAQSLGFTRLLAVWFDVSLAECLKRNQGRSRQVPPEIIETMSRQLAGAPPHPKEGFAAVYRLG